MENDKEYAEKAAPDPHLQKLSGIGDDGRREQERRGHGDETLAEGHIFEERPIGKPTKLFEQCAACHALDETKTDGPTLKGVFGRKAGSLEDFRYSVAMKRTDIVWDVTTMDRFMADPQAYIRGNRMAFAGMTDKAERDDLIAYLQENAK